jgi:hypothetical protein
VEHVENGFRKSNILLGLLWLNFVALWGRVHTITTVRDLKDSLYCLGVVTAAYSLLVVIWVVHNIRIFRKKGPRLTVRQVNFSSRRDSLNQQINQTVDVRCSRNIAVHVIRGQKLFMDGAKTPSVSRLTGVGD